MEIKFLHTYRNLGIYLEHLQEEQAWEEDMIAPFWPQISEWAPFPIDYMKPAPVCGRETILEQIAQFQRIDFPSLRQAFEKIALALPKGDDDPMTIAFYPSENQLEEGVFGTGAWGNIILNINPTNKNAAGWIPFVFAHEYHHNALGFYWYCLKGGAGTKGNLLETLINEGQADAFAKSLFPSSSPSWHQEIPADRVRAVWDKFEECLYVSKPTEQFAQFLYGDEDLGIPPYAGYSFGYQIVSGFMEKHPDVGFAEMIRIPHQTIYDECH